MLTGHSTVLMMSDELAAVYSVVRGKYKLVGDVQWNDPDVVPILSELLKDKAKGKPVKILYDMVEQYYRREIVPKVAIFDQQHVIDRRLTAAFPNYPMRRAFPLKDHRKSKTSEAEKVQNVSGKPYLFSALPQNDLIANVVDAVRTSMTRVQGIYLLPIESVSMIQKLSAYLNKGDIDPDRWIVFMTQQHGGGLRQIVVRNGELSLTRLTTIMETTTEHATWASQVAQEFTATMGYISRFGFNADSQLEVIVLGHPEGVDNLRSLIKANSFFGMTVNEALGAVRLSGSTSDHPYFADVLYVAWLSHLMRSSYAFQTPELTRISRTRLGSLILATTMVLGAMGGMIYFGQELWNMKEQLDNVSLQTSRLEKVESQRKQLLATIETSQLNIKLVQGSVSVFNSLEKNKLDLVDFTQKMREALTSDFALDKVSVSLLKAQQTSNDPLSVATIETQLLLAQLDVSFPGTMAPEDANKMVSDFRTRLAQSFTDYDVVITQSPKDLTYGTEYTFSTSDKGKPKTDQGRLTAVLEMKQRPSEVKP